MQERRAHLSGTTAQAARRFLSTRLTLVCLLLFVVPYAPAQTAERSTRKVISTVKPAYPQTLRNLHIEGLVRLKVTVAANGTVGEIKVIGGNPILVESGIKAVKNWKYAPGPTQTEEEIVLNFFDR